MEAVDIETKSRVCDTVGEQLACEEEMDSSIESQ